METLFTTCHLVTNYWPTFDLLGFWPFGTFYAFLALWCLVFLVLFGIFWFFGIFWYNLVIFDKFWATMVLFGIFWKFLNLNRTWVYNGAWHCCTVGVVQFLFFHQSIALMKIERTSLKCEKLNKRIQFLHSIYKFRSRSYIWKLVGFLRQCISHARADILTPRDSVRAGPQPQKTRVRGCHQSRRRQGHRWGHRRRHRRQVAGGNCSGGWPADFDRPGFMWS